MPQSLAKILVHTVFSTKDHRPFLRDKSLRDELHRYLGGILAKHDCQPLIIGGVEDHVHLLSTLARTCTAAEMVKEVKRGSSLWLKTKSPELNDFAWQNGYGIFSIGFSQVEEVKHYIAGQEEHHRKISFQDEFRQSLRRFHCEPPAAQDSRAPVHPAGNSVLLFMNPCTRRPQRYTAGSCCSWRQV